MNYLHFAPLSDLWPDVEVLCGEAAAEGFRFLDRLANEWRSGTNRFAQPGEVFLAAYRGVDLVAVGGLNRDPYVDQGGVGRLRHLYVKRAARRCGVGTALVRELLGYAEGVFQSVRLRTEAPEAANFYAAVGFRRVSDETATHIWP